ncbi:50S ribosomal protein L32 [Patescibacteria group bacterium]|nr:50S ribosomal protein L32 [Patescibacteria group bacterium]
MTPLPKRKLSRKRQGKRRAALTLRLASLITCPKCQKPKLPHMACKFCGARS